jgi:hypothetical protein
MVALAILAMTLVVLLEIVTNNVRATNHAKQTTIAAFLARGKMIDVEDVILENGFSNDDETANGNFKDQGSPDFRWEYAIERIELPTDMARKTQDQAQDQTKDSKDPMSMISGFMGGMMSTFLEPIRIGLEESVRKVSVRVFWDEPGRLNQTVEVVQYLTDPAKLDSALTGGAMGAPGTPGAPAAPGGAPSVPGLTPPVGLPGVTR